jgi:hypothetical protein
MDSTAALDCEYQVIVIAANLLFHDRLRADFAPLVEQWIL